MHRALRGSHLGGRAWEGGEVRFAEDGGRVHTGVHRTSGTRVEQSAAWCPDSCVVCYHTSHSELRTCST